jgi:hypothetical protein
VLPCVPWLRVLPSSEGSLSATTCPKARPDRLWTTRIKKDLAVLGTQVGSRVFKTRSRVTEVSARHAATMWLYNAASTQLITPRYSYRGDMTRQDGTTVRAMFSAVE